MPSSTSLMPSFWPANTVEMLIRSRCRQAAASGADVRPDYDTSIKKAVPKIFFGTAEFRETYLKLSPGGKTGSELTGLL